jgi:hypothetical protein
MYFPLSEHFCSDNTINQASTDPNISLSLQQLSMILASWSIFDRVDSIVRQLEEESEERTVSHPRTTPCRMNGPGEFRTYTSHRYGFKSKVDRLIDLTLICSLFIHVEKGDCA